MDDTLNQVKALENKKYKPLYSYKGKMGKHEVIVVPFRETEQGWLFVLETGEKDAYKIIEEEKLSNLKEKGVDPFIISILISDEKVNTNEVFDLIAQLKKDKLEYNRNVGEKIKSLFGSLGGKLSDPMEEDGDLDGNVKACKIAFNLRMIGHRAEQIIKGLNKLTEDNQLLLPLGENDGIN